MEDSKIETTMVKTSKVEITEKDSKTEIMMVNSKIEIKETIDSKIEIINQEKAKLKKN